MSNLLYKQWKSTVFKKHLEHTTALRGKITGGCMLIWQLELYHMVKLGKSWLDHILLPSERITFQDLIKAAVMQGCNFYLLFPLLESPMQFFPPLPFCLKNASKCKI